MSEKAKLLKQRKSKLTQRVGSQNTNPQTETSSKDGETKSQDSTANSGEVPNKSIAAKSASQKSISHFSSVSTPEYRAGWDKIFGDSKLEQSPPERLTKYDQRTALVSEEWRNYKGRVGSCYSLQRTTLFWSSRGWRRNSGVASSNDYATT